jgi:DNA-binding transcriptional ArsR family regulator
MLPLLREPWEAHVTTTPGDEQQASLSDAQADLFASLGDVTRIGIIRCLGDGGPHPIAQIGAGVGGDWRTVREHVDALQRRGVLGSHHDSAFTRYDVKDRRIFQLLELASEIMDSRGIRSEDWVPDRPMTGDGGIESASAIA